MDWGADTPLGGLVVYAHTCGSPEALEVRGPQSLQVGKGQKLLPGRGAGQAHTLVHTHARPWEGRASEHPSR